MEANKDKLEKFILENRSDFDVYEPGDQVWEKILLKKEQKKIKSINWFSISWKVAAAVAIFFISLWVHNLTSEKQVTRIIIAQQNNEPVIPELQEAEAYYTKQVDQKLQELYTYASSNPEIKADVKRDLEELDNIYKELKNDLNDNAGNREIIEAMIQNYRLKLEILEDLLSRLKNTDNNDIKETTSYEL
ncbi:MAG: hypothetical protein A2W91_14085 [Bacteroidetes bacterium GWF2_38_335]|nr:MAG: hypothetical protein A2W91_14085 [Bacteroidetes bacterium GWF2_38_335]OFY77843.1 MAG: hypothetical protein A2281_15775 [Bacteroidetes bacterium RIFOXYA12_FULL_38_20]HBS87348.1 hypothetical protein [Bacteroidales bacterium]